MTFVQTYNALIAHEYEGGLDHGRRGLMPLHEYVVKSQRFEPKRDTLSDPVRPYQDKIGGVFDMTPVRDYTEGYIKGLTEFIREHMPIFPAPQITANLVFSDLPSNLIYIAGMSATKPSKVRELAPKTPLNEEKYGLLYRLGAAVSFVRLGYTPRVVNLEVIPLEDNGWKVMNKNPKKFGRKIARL
jgi:hypothetical protein